MRAAAGFLDPAAGEWAPEQALMLADNAVTALTVNSGLHR